MPATPPSDNRSGRWRLIGVGFATLLLAATAVEMTVFATAWSDSTTALWGASAGAMARGLSGVISIAALALAIGLPILGRHWPGLLSGRRWRAVGWLGYGLFTLMLAVYSATFRAVGPPGDAHWSAACELRANALYRCLLLLLALPLLFGARGPQRRSACDSAA